MTDDTQQRAARIRLVAFDVDGVLTDGSIYYFDEGGEAKAFNTKDGYGIRLLLRHGIEVAVVSGYDSAATWRRLNRLGVAHAQLGRDDKRQALSEVLHACDCRAEEAAYMGDDLQDLPAMEAAGLACAVADAHPEVRRRAHWVSAAPGGRGAARELCDFVLRAQGRLETPA